MRLFMLGLAVLVIAACGTATESGTETPETDTPTVIEVDAEPAAPAPDATGAECGGFANILCPSGYYCEKPVGQCLEVMDGVGACQVQPEVCTREYRPVCGCDGQTYPNACEAAAAGVSVAATGECGGVMAE